MTRPLEASLVRELRRIVGDAAVVSSRDRLLSYESDGLTAYRAAPTAVVLPADTDESVRVLAALHRAEVPVVPRGAGTGLSGGAVATTGGVVVGTARMNRILELDPANRRARLQSGTVNARLSDAARPHGLYYAPDPSSQTACTLGGNVAENSGGPHCLKYGVTSRYVTGLTLVLPDGEQARLGGVSGGPGGLDLVGVVVGSEGCFGLVTEIEVELLPLPEGVRTLLAVFDEIEDAGRAVTDIMGRGLLPAALEIVDRETIRAVESSVYAAGYPVDAGAALVVEFDGVDAGLDDDLDRAESCCRTAGAREVRRARDEAERSALWKGRKKAFGAMGRVAPDLMVQDATVPRTRLPEVLGRIGDIARRYDLKVANVFHAGDGNLHPNILFDRRDAGELERVEQASREIMKACVDAGGTITGEHGVGIDKRDYMPLVHGPAELSAMADVRAVFDPHGRFNPGKVLPEGVVPSLPSSPGGRASAATPAPYQVEEELTELLGEGTVERGADGRPAVRPSSVEQVAAVLELAHRSGWRVRPVGAGHEPAPHDDARPADLLLRTTRLRSVERYEPGDLTATVGAGLTLEALAERTHQEGQWLPVDPPGADTATVGGVLATGLGGSLAGSFGRPRDLVLGLTCVTGDARVLRLGGRVVKNVAGFDLVKLLVGSRGRLGVIAEATVRLFPRPEVDRVLAVRADRAEALLDRVRSIATAPLAPAALDLTEGLHGDEGAWMAVRLLGSASSVDAQERRLRERVPDLNRWGPAEAQAGMRAARMGGAGADLAVRLAFSPADLTAVLAAVRKLDAEARGSASGRTGMVVHGSRGVLRWWAQGSGEADPDRWAPALAAVRRVVEQEGGGMNARVGGRRPNPALPGGGGDPAGRRLEAALEARFDPGSVLSDEAARDEPASPAGAVP